MAKNAYLPAATGKSLNDQGVELLDNITFHFIVFIPGSLRSIKIKPGPGTKIPILLLTRYLGASGAGIRSDQYHPMLSGKLLGSRLDHVSFLSAGQHGQKKQHRTWDLTLTPWIIRMLGRRQGLRLGWQIDRKTHGQADMLRRVFIITLPPLKIGRASWRVRM